MKLLLLLIIVATTLTTFAQSVIDDEQDKCGIKPAHASKGNISEYTYDSLLLDLDKWQQSKYCFVDSIGASTQGRTIWLASILNLSPAKNALPVISIHARTHPNEVQAQHVTNKMIEILLGTSELAGLLRNNCVFNFVPMLNPDGVELGYERENANRIDIESNWNADTLEAEVQVMQDYFTYLMQGGTPIRIALNMHSAWACKRYFVVHDAAGTSASYFQDEKDFITAIRNYFPTGIENWDYMVTWTSSTPNYYPESFFWLNYGESVMALTYEDMNCSTAGDYEKTADAILNGIADYLGLKTFSDVNELKQETFSMYPNPAEDVLTISLPSQIKSMEVIISNSLGQVAFTQQLNNSTTQHLNISQFPAGLYVVRVGNHVQKLIVK